MAGVASLCGIKVMAPALLFPVDDAGLTWLQDSRTRSSNPAAQ